MLEDKEVTDFTGATASSQLYSSYGAYRVLDGSTNTYWNPYLYGGHPGGNEWIAVTLPEPRLVTEVTLTWYSSSDRVYGAADYDIEASDGAVWVPVAQVRGNEQATARLTLSSPYRTDQVRIVLYTSIDPSLYRPLRLAEVDARYRPLVSATGFTQTLPDGDYTFTVTAVNGYGFEGLPSDPAGLILGTPIVLSATVDGSDVHLEWTAAWAEVARYELYRDGGKIADITDLDNRTYIDEDLLNGTYHYFVRPVDLVGTVGAQSNEVESLVDVPLPPPPVLISVEPVPAGGTLDLLWEPGQGALPQGYEVQRATVSGGFPATDDCAGCVRRTGQNLDDTVYPLGTGAADPWQGEVLHEPDAGGCRPPHRRPVRQQDQTGRCR